MRTRTGAGKARLFSRARGQNGTVEFSLREPKAKFDGVTEDWGTRPLQRCAKRTIMALVSFARAVFSRHIDAQYRVHFDPAASILETNVSFPVSVRRDHCLLREPTSMPRVVERR